jgi:hypothetical protein
MATNANTLPRAQATSCVTNESTRELGVGALKLAIRRLRRQRAAGGWQAQIEIGRETGARC